MSTKKVNRKLSFEEDSSSEDESFSGSIDSDDSSSSSSEDDSSSHDLVESNSEPESPKPAKKKEIPSTPTKTPKKSIAPPPTPKKAKPGTIHPLSPTITTKNNKSVSKVAEEKKSTTKPKKDKTSEPKKEKKEKKLDVDKVVLLLRGYKIYESEETIKKMKKHNKNLFKQLCKSLSEEATYKHTDRTPTGRLFILSKEKLQVHNEAKEATTPLEEHKFISLSDFSTVVTLTNFPSKKVLEIRTIVEEISEKESEKLNEELGDIKKKERHDSQILYALIKKKIIASQPAVYASSVGATVVCWPQEKQSFWLNSEESKKRLGPVVLVSTTKITTNNVSNEQKKLLLRRTELLSILSKTEGDKTEFSPPLPQKKRKLMNVPTDEEEAAIFEQERIKKKAKTAAEQTVKPKSSKSDSVPTQKMEVEKKKTPTPSEPEKKKKKEKTSGPDVALIGITSKADKAEVKRKVKEMDSSSQTTYSAHIKTSLPPNIVLAALENGGIEELQRRIKAEEILLTKASEMSNKNVEWFREHCK